MTAFINLDIQKTDFVEIDKNAAKRLKNSNRYEYLICYFNDENKVKSDVSGFIEYDGDGEIVNLVLDPDFKRRGKTTPEFLIDNADVIWMAKNGVTKVKQKQQRMADKSNATALRRNLPWGSGQDKSGYNKYGPAIRGKMVDRLMTKRSDSLDYRRKNNYD